MTDTITKADIVKAVEELPDDATLEDAMERLFFLYKVERGLKEIESGETFSLEEARRYFRQRRHEKER